LITPLIGAGILRSTRGPKGGISLAKPAHEIKLSEVIYLLEGSIDPAECINNPGLCNRSGWCAPQDIWIDIKKAVNRQREAE
jgi:Rrf2 family protein